MKQRIGIIGLWLIFILLAAYILAKGPSIQSDLGQFLPQGNENHSELLLDTLRDSPASRLLLLDLSGAPATQLADAARQLSTELTASPHFQHVLGTQNALPEKEQALLLRYRYLLTDTKLDETSLRQGLQRQLQLLLSGAPVDHKRLQTDPSDEFLRLQQRMNNTDTPTQRHGVWFSDDQKHALLLLHTSAPAFDLNRQEEALTTIDSAFTKLQQPQLRMLLSGPPLFGVESRRLIRNTSQQLSIIASLGVALLTMLFFRSVHVTILIALPLISGILIGAATVTWLYDSLHGIALAFGITLIGLAIDYPIHLFSHGGGRQSAMRLWPTLRLGAVTTALGFSALLFSDFSGLSQMGLFAISGIITAALVTRWVLPALHSGEHYLSLTLPQFFSHRRAFIPAWLPLLLLLSSVIMLAVRDDTLWESHLERLSPISEAQLKQDRLLRSRLPTPEPGKILLLEGESPEQLLQRSEALSIKLDMARAKGVLGGYDAPSRYLPSIQRQLQQREMLPDTDTLKTIIDSASQGLPFREGIFQLFSDDVAESHTLAPLTPPALDGTLTGMRLANLLRTKGKEHYALITLKDVRDKHALSRIAEEFDAQYLDLPQQAARLIDHYRRDALQWMALGGIGIFLLLVGTLRSTHRTLRILLPVISAIATTTALLHLLGEALSLFHLVSLLLVLGIGLDYALFTDRCQIHKEERQRIVESLLVCGTTTLLVFGILAFSAVPVLHAIGLTVSLGVSLTLLFTLGGKKEPQ